MIGRHSCQVWGQPCSSTTAGPEPPITACSRTPGATSLITWSKPSGVSDILFSFSRGGAGSAGEGQPGGAHHLEAAQRVVGRDERTDPTGGDVREVRELPCERVGTRDGAAV